MKKVIRSAGEVLVRRVKRQNVAMLTCTMPYTKADLVRRFLIEWAGIQRQFCQELKRELERRGLPGNLIWVTELQDRRGAAEGYPCPHLHMLFQGRHNGRGWAISPARIKGIWNRIVENACQISFDGSASTRIEAVRSNAAAYITKYLCKASKGPAQWVGTEWEKFLPKRYARVTGELRKDVDRMTAMLRGAGAYAIAHDLQHLADSGEVALTFSDGSSQCGFVLDRKTFEETFAYYREIEAVDAEDQLSFELLPKAKGFA